MEVLTIRPLADKLAPGALFGALSRAAGRLESQRDLLPDGFVTDIDAVVHLSGRLEVGQMSLRKSAGKPLDLLACCLERLPVGDLGTFIADVTSGEREPRAEFVEIAKALVKTTQEEQICRASIKGMILAEEV